VATRNGLQNTYEISGEQVWRCDMREVPTKKATGRRVKISIEIVRVGD
jgi:hypothetical protein